MCRRVVGHLKGLHCAGWEAHTVAITVNKSQEDHSLYQELGTILSQMIPEFSYVVMCISSCPSEV